MVGRRIRLAADVARLEAASRASAASPVPVAHTGMTVASPWATGTLSPIVVADIYGALDVAELPVDRALALSVPALHRACGLVTGAVGRLPLRSYRAEVELDAPTWAYATSGDLHPSQRMALTCEDLILDGWSLWRVTRGAGAAITSASWVPGDQWGFDANGLVTDSDGRAFDASEVVLFRGPHAGILTLHSRTIRGAISLERAWIRAARNPVPAAVLQQTTDDELTNDEVTGLLATWRTARADPDGAVAFLDSRVELKAYGANDAAVLEGARNAVAVDIARIVGVPSVAIDAGPPAQGLDYRNVNQSTGVQLPLYGFQPYTDVIGWRLSMDDVTPRGTRMELDTTTMYAVPADPTAPETRD